MRTMWFKSVMGASMAGASSTAGAAAAAGAVAMRSDKLALPTLMSACVAVAEHAGAVIREVARHGQLHAIDKADGRGATPSRPLQDPQTLADRRAQLVIVHSLRKLFPGLVVVGEEGDLSLEADTVAGKLVDEICASNAWRDRVVIPHPEALAPLPLVDTVVWVDPLDGTNEFTKGVLDSVTTLVGISVAGRPVAGVIHQPFASSSSHRSVWGAVGVGVFGHNAGRAAAAARGRRIITITKSRLTPQLERLIASLQPDEVVRLGGSGRKILAILDGEADAYVYPGTGTSKWDICACEALLVAAGGRVSDKQDVPYSFVAHAAHANVHGVVASGSRTLHGDLISRIAEFEALDGELSAATAGASLSVGHQPARPLAGAHIVWLGERSRPAQSGRCFVRYADDAEPRTETFDVVAPADIGTSRWFESHIAPQLRAAGEPTCELCETTLAEAENALFMRRAAEQRHWAPRFAWTVGDAIQAARALARVHAAGMACGDLDALLPAPRASDDARLPVTAVVGRPLTHTSFFFPPADKADGPAMFVDHACLQAGTPVNNIADLVALLAEPSPSAEQRVLDEYEGQLAMVANVPHEALSSLRAAVALRQRPPS